MQRVLVLLLCTVLPTTSRRSLQIAAAFACLLIGISPTWAAAPNKPSAPAAFTQNVGQVRYTTGGVARHVDAMVDDGANTWYVHAGGIHIVQSALHGSVVNDPTIDLYRIDAVFVGANTSVRLEVETLATGYERYIVPGTGVRGRKAWRAQTLVYHDVWPGIDVRMHCNTRGVKVDYVVRPGADPSVIALRYLGATSVNRTSSGTVEFTSPLRTVVESAPIAWTSDHQSVDVHTQVQGSTLRYELGDFDQTQTLVIDPQIEFATYYGKNGTFNFVKTTIDPDGNIFIAGSTITRDLPAVAGVFQPNLKARTDAFVGKFTDAGVFVWNTYVGGTGMDYCYDVCADTSGNVWLCGSLDSLNNPLSDTNRALDDRGSGPFGGLPDDTISFVAGWVMRVTSTGDWGDSWIMDGSRNDRCTGIAFKNNVLAICGETNSPRVSDKTGGAWAKNGANNTNNYDLFIARCSLRTGSTDRWQGDWLAYYGGDLEDRATCIAIDAFGNIACAGNTMSTNVPVTNSSTLRGGFDGVVVYFATVAGAPDRRWATYLGGSDATDFMYDAAMDSNGNPVIVGATGSANFPTHLPYQAARNGFGDGFVVKFNASNNGAMIFGTYLGGQKIESIFTVSLDKSDRVWVGGVTNGSTDLPVTADALQSVPNTTATWPDLTDGFFAQLSADGSKVLYCTYYGAQPQDNLPDPPTPPDPPNWPPNTDFGYDQVEGLQADGNAYVAITSTVTGRRMATTPGAFMDATKMNADTTKQVAFLSLFNTCPDSTINIVVNGTPVLCNNETRQLRGPAGFASYKWSNGVKAQNIVVADSGTYILTATTVDGCRYRDTVYITRAAAPSVSIGDSVSTCINTSVQLIATVTGGNPQYSYKWKRLEAGPTYIDADDVERPFVNPNTTSHYIVTVTDALGCTATDTVLVTVINPTTTIAPATLAFRELDACESAVDDSVWVRNPMPYEIWLTKATTSDPVFSVVTDLSSGLRIAPLDSVLIVIRATPLAPGAASGVLTCSGTPCKWTSTASLSVTKAQLVASLVPSIVDFGSMLDCMAAARDTTVTVRNSGTNIMELGVGVFQAPFSLVSPLTSTELKPGESVKLTVRFEPTALGTYSQVVKLPFVSGTCTDSLRLTLRGKRVSAAIVVDPTSIDLGSMEGCEDSKDTVIRIINSGTTASTITLPSTSEIVFTPTGTVDIAPDDTLEVKVNVRPATSGPFTYQVTITGQPCNSSVTLTITGTKSGTSVTATPVVDFGTVYPCAGSTSYTKQIEVTYSGTGSATVTSVAVPANVSTTLKQGTVLDNGVKQTFDVTWTPTADGYYVDSIDVVLEPCSIRRIIRIVGFRANPQITSLDPVITLGAMAGPVTGTSRYENTGTDTLRITAVTVSTNISVVATRPSLPAQLAPGERLEVDYRVACVESIDDSLSLVIPHVCALSATTRFTGSCAGTGPASATVVIDSVQVKVGDQFSLRLRLTESMNLDANNLQNWEADVIYDPMVVVGRASTPDCFTAGNFQPCMITIRGTRTDSIGVLGTLDFTAILGMQSQTDVVLARFRWTEDTTSAVTTGNGHVTITDICQEGGIRLLIPSGSLFAINAYPIPASSTLTVSVQGMGTDVGTCALYTYTGEYVQDVRLTPNASGNALEQVDVAMLSPGVYVLSINARGTTYRLPVLITR